MSRGRIATKSCSPRDYRHERAPAFTAIALAPLRPNGESSVASSLYATRRPGGGDSVHQRGAHVGHDSQPPPTCRPAGPPTTWPPARCGTRSLAAGDSPSSAPSWRTSGDASRSVRNPGERTSCPPLREPGTVGWGCLPPRARAVPTRPRRPGPRRHRIARAGPAGPDRGRFGATARDRGDRSGQPIDDRLDDHGLGQVRGWRGRTALTCCGYYHA